MRSDAGIDAVDGRRFCEWLAVAADRVGAPGEVELCRVLVENGCYCTPSTVASWLTGTGEPSPEKARLLLGALNAALPEVDVWEQYGRWKNGEPYFTEQDEVQKAVRAPSLQDVVEASGLPPPLTE